MQKKPLSDQVSATNTLWGGLMPHQIVLIVVGFVASIGGTVWWIARANRTQRLNDLYASASGGDVDSVRRLNEFSFSYAGPWLQVLADNRTAAPDSRVAVIKVLASNAPFDRTRLLPLLQIDQPFVVRHAAAEVFEQNRCGDACISAALYGLHTIWRGDPAFEVGLSAVEQKYGVHTDPQLKASINAELRAKTEKDYRVLLDSNPCVVHNVLRRDYGSEPAFLEGVQAQVESCSH